MIESTSIEELDKSNLRVKIVISSDEAHKAYAKIVKETIQKMQLPGFRKGKVPQAVLEKKFGEALRHDAAQTLIEEGLKEYFDKTETKALSYESPVIEKIPVYTKNEAFEFEVLYDVFPKVELKQLSDFSIEIPQVSIDSDIVTQELVKMQEQNAVVKEKTGVVAEGDLIRYTLYTLNEDDDRIAESKRESELLVSKEELSKHKLSAAIIGLEKSASAVIDLLPSNDSAARERAEITISSIRERDLPAIDDELAQDISEDFKTLEDLKENIVERLSQRLERQLTALRDRSLLSKIAEANPITLPESMVVAEFNNKYGNLLRQLRRVEESETSEEEDRMLFNTLRPEIESNIRHELIVQSLIEERKIEANADALEKRVQEEAEYSGRTVQETEKYLKDTGKLEEIIHQDQYTQIIEELLQASTVHKGEEITYSEFIARRRAEQEQ